MKKSLNSLVLVIALFLGSLKIGIIKWAPYIASGVAVAQNYSTQGNSSDNSWSVFETNSPSSLYGNRRNPIHLTTNWYLYFRTRKIILDTICHKIKSMNNAKTLWVDSVSGEVWSTLVPTQTLQVETDPIWISDKTNYYTKTLSDARYLQSYTETDPVWLADKSNYYTKTLSDARYLQSFTESDPLWAASSSYTITNTQTGNWNTAFGWGNHASAGYITPSSSSVLTNKSGNISQWTNNSGYITGYTPTLSLNGSTLSAGGNSVILASPTFTAISAGAGVSITSGTVVINTLPHITSTITAGTSISVTTSGNSFTVTDTNTLTSLTASTGISVTNGSVITNTIPDRTVSITAGNQSITVSGTYPNFVLTPYTPISFTVTRAVNSSTFQPSTTKQAFVFYTIRINCVATIGGTASGTVSLQHSIDNGSTWVDDGQVENSNAVTLAIVLNSNTTQTSQISAVIPAGAICRLVTSNNGATITYVRGNETY